MKASLKNNLPTIFNVVLSRHKLTCCFYKDKNNHVQLLTNNGDAALSSYFHYFVHQGFGSFGELVPFKDSNWTIPHYLLGSSHNFNKLLNTFRAAVQALWQENSEISFLAAYLESPMSYWWDPQMLFSPLLFHLTLKLTRLLEGLMVLILCPQICC